MLGEAMIIKESISYLFVMLAFAIAKIWLTFKEP